MAHVEHYSRTVAYKIGYELDGENTEIREKYIDENHNIDPARTKDNYSLPGCNSREEFVALLEKRLSEIPHNKRKDLNVISSLVVTCPEQFVGTPNEAKFFEATEKFLKARYGEKNVIAGFVHRDETTPHCHYMIVPVAERRLVKADVIENGKPKLQEREDSKHKGKPLKTQVRTESEKHISASDLFDMQELLEFHPAFDAYCEAEFGIKGLVHNGQTLGKSKKAQRDIKFLRVEEKELQAENNALRAKNKQLQKQVDAFPAKLETVKAMATKTLTDANAQAKAIIDKANIQAKEITDKANAEWEKASEERKKAVKSKNQFIDAYDRTLAVATGYGATELERKGISDYIVHGRTGLQSKKTGKAVSVDMLTVRRNVGFNIKTLPQTGADYEYE